MRDWLDKPEPEAELRGVEHCVISTFQVAESNGFQGRLSPNVAAPRDRGFDHISAPQFQATLICSDCNQ
jgi:hypothetical protein